MQWIPLSFPRIHPVLIRTCPERHLIADEYLAACFELRNGASIHSSAALVLTCGSCANQDRGSFRRSDFRIGRSDGGKSVRFGNRTYGKPSVSLLRTSATKHLCRFAHGQALDSLAGTARNDRGTCSVWVTQCGARGSVRFPVGSLPRQPSHFQTVGHWDAPQHPGLQWTGETVSGATVFADR